MVSLVINVPLRQNYLRFETLTKIDNLFYMSKFILNVLFILTTTCTLNYDSRVLYSVFNLKIDFNILDEVVYFKMSSVEI